MHLAASPLLQNLVFEDPWPLALTFIVIGAVVAFIAIQRADKRLLRFAGLALLLAAAVFLLAGLVTTTHEQVIAATEELVDYTAPLQLSAFRSMVDAKVVVTIGEAGEASPITGDEVFERLEKTVESQVIAAQTIISIDAQVPGDDDAITAFDLRTDLPAGGRFMTRWRLTWRRQGDGNWRVTAVQWLESPHLIGVKPSARWLR